VGNAKGIGFEGVRCVCGQGSVPTDVDGYIKFASFDNPCEMPDDVAHPRKHSRMSIVPLLPSHNTQYAGKSFKLPLYIAIIEDDVVVFEILCSYADVHIFNTFDFNA